MRLVSSLHHEPGTLGQPPSFGIAQTAADVVFDQALGATELAQGR